MNVARRPLAAPSRRYMIVALLALAAAFAAQVHRPLFLRAPLGYLLMGVIPGWLLAERLLRSPGSTAEERGMASLVRGIPPQNPSYAGLRMNYMWQLHVWVVALVEAMGLSVFRVFPLIARRLTGGSRPLWWPWA